MGKPLNLTGQRFGRLLAIEPTDKRADGKVVWKFVCDCGNTAEVSSKQAKSGRTQSCGCLQVDRLQEYAAARRTDKVCPECGAEFQVKNSHALKTTYCGKVCMAAAYRKRLAGSSNPNWRDMPLHVRVETQRAKHRQYRAEHKEVTASYNRNAKARRRKAEGSHTKADVDALRIRQGGCCAACKGGLYGEGHVDHIIPLARGGSNFVGNIQILCSSCNLSKRALLPIEFKWRVLHGTTEEAEQSKVMAWAHENGDGMKPLRLLYHAANGGHRTKRTAARMQSVGVKKGVPDLTMPCARHGFFGLFIEMKVGRNKPTPEQLAWHAALRAEGYRVEVCYGAESAIAVLEEYLS